MKKNKMLRLAAVILVLTLLSTSVISGTFAKYVTEGSGSDTARVAKFGVEVTNGGGLFLKNYAKTDSSYTLGANTVASIDEWKLVAPGTNYSNTDVVLSGKPEVAVKVTYEITDLTVSGDWSDNNGDPYFPIIFSVDGVEYYIGKDSTINSISTLIEAVKTAAAGYSMSYEPNTDLSTKAGDALDISWRWEFEGEKAGATLSGYQYDYRDTALGDKAADAGVGSELAIRLEIKTTVTQID